MAISIISTYNELAKMVVSHIYQDNVHVGFMTIDDNKVISDVTWCSSDINRHNRLNILDSENVYYIDTTKFVYAIRQKDISIIVMGHYDKLTKSKNEFAKQMANRIMANVEKPLFQHSITDMQTLAPARWFLININHFDVAYNIQKG